MFAFLFPCLLVLLATFQDDRPTDREILADHWFLALEGESETGWTNVVTSRVIRDGRVLVRTETTSASESYREGDLMRGTSQSWVLEDEAGRVLEMHTIEEEEGARIQYDLIVDGEQAHVTTTILDVAETTAIPWGDILGPHGVRELLRSATARGQSPLTYQTFEFGFAPETTTTMIRGEVEVDLVDGQVVEAIHLVSTSEIFEGIEVHQWIDKDFYDLLWDIDFGVHFRQVRTTEERARAFVPSRSEDELGEGKTNVLLPRLDVLDSVLYRFVGTAGRELPRSLAPHRVDSPVGTNVAELAVGIRVPDSLQPLPLSNTPEDLHKYLAPSPYVQVDHLGIHETARALAEGLDTWSAATALETFTLFHITDKNYSTGFASAAEVYENRCGDCSEHAVLLTALCRAAGIPARVVLGYLCEGRSLIGHAWTEVWIHGEWYGLDATLGMGHTTPCHLRLDATALDDAPLAAFVAIVQTLLHVEAQVVSFELGGRTILVDDEYQRVVIEDDQFRDLVYQISIDKPAGFEFLTDEDEPSIVAMIIGESVGVLEVQPANSPEDIVAAMVVGEATLEWDAPREIAGRPVSICTLEDADGLFRIAVISRGPFSFVLTVSIEQPEGDHEFFSDLLGSISFLD